MSIWLTLLILFVSVSPLRPEPHGRAGGSQPGQADSPLPEQEEEILGSDDDEQEDPNDYCKGKTSLSVSDITPHCNTHYEKTSRNNRFSTYWI